MPRPPKAVHATCSMPLSRAPRVRSVGLHSASASSSPTTTVATSSSTSPTRCCASATAAGRHAACATSSLRVRRHRSAPSTDSDSACWALSRPTLHDSPGVLSTGVSTRKPPASSSLEKTHRSLAISRAVARTASASTSTFWASPSWATTKPQPASISSHPEYVAPMSTTSPSRSPRCAPTSTCLPGTTPWPGSPSAWPPSTASRRRTAPSSTSTWRSTATSSSPSRPSSACSTSQSSTRCPRASCSRPTSPTPTPRSTDSSRGRMSATPRVARPSRSGSSRAPTSRWSRSRPNCTTGLRLPTTRRRMSTPRTSACSRPPCARPSRAHCAWESPRTTSSMSHGRSPCATRSTIRR